MLRMFLTREVFQPEMSALKLPSWKKSRLMSVTPETHQPPMGPYFAMAAAAFELYSVTAVLREALSAKGGSCAEGVQIKQLSLQSSRYGTVLHLVITSILVVTSLWQKSSH